MLVLAPANLLMKWQAELRERFDEEFEIRDARWMRENLVEVAEDGEIRAPSARFVQSNPRGDSQLSWTPHAQASIC